MHYFSPLNTFMRKGKDPEPDPYLWPMDPDPGGPKTCGSGSGSGSPKKLLPLKQSFNLWTVISCTTFYVNEQRTLKNKICMLRLKKYCSRFGFDYSGTGKCYFFTSKTPVLNMIWIFSSFAAESGSAIKICFWSISSKYCMCRDNIGWVEPAAGGGGIRAGEAEGVGQPTETGPRVPAPGQAWRNRTPQGTQLILRRTVL